MGTSSAFLVFICVRLRRRGLRRRQSRRRNHRHGSLQSHPAVNLVLNGVEKACSLEANATYEITFEQADWNIVLFGEK